MEDKLIIIFFHGRLILQHKDEIIGVLQHFALNIMDYYG